MILACLTGLVVSGRTDAGAMAVVFSIALYINAKQALILWMRRQGEERKRARAVFLLQVSAATLIALLIFWKSIITLSPYIVVPFVYLTCLKFLGEHAIVTELSGFVLLSMSSLVAKLAMTGIIDLKLFLGTALFFAAAVFKVKVQLKKGMSQRLMMIGYVGFALAFYRLLSLPVLVLLPLVDNLLFSVGLYRMSLRVTGWLEVLKGIGFVLLMRLYYS